MGGEWNLGELWPWIAGIVGIIVWAVRTESRVYQAVRELDHLGRRHDSLQMKHELLDSKTVEELSRVRESLARIEGALRIGGSD